MFRSIVVGTDGSETAGEAVREAIELAKAVGASVDLVSDEELMRLALAEAERAGERGEAPIGAVVARAGEVLGAAGNERELRADPTAHAEALAIRAAAALVIASGVIGRRPKPGDVEARLTQTATDVGLPGSDTTYGAGRLDAATATEPVP